MTVFNPPCSLLFQLIDHDLSPWRAWILENWYQVHFMSTIKCYRPIHHQSYPWQRLLSGCALCFSTCFQILTLRFHEFNAVVITIVIQQSVTRLSMRMSVLPVDIHVDRVWVNFTPLHLRFFSLVVSYLTVLIIIPFCDDRRTSWSLRSLLRDSMVSISTQTPCLMYTWSVYTSTRDSFSTLYIWLLCITESRLTHRNL